MNRKKLALRPYIESVEKICAELTKQELTDLIVNLAGNESPTERQSYLAKLMVCLVPEGTPAENPPAPHEVQSLLEELQEFKESIKARIASIEDGSYWDDPDDFEDYDYYSHEDPEYLNEEQKDGFAEFFEDADNYFLQNRLHEAKKLYEALFALLGGIEDYGYGVDIEVDLKEAHTRYCRIVYELTPKSERLREMAMAMDIEQPQVDFEGLRGNDMAMFQDVIDAQVGKLPDMENFLILWDKLMAQKGHNPDRLAHLRVEAAAMLSGVAGVQKLAQTWKENQPIGYLAWMEYLSKSKQWQDLCDVAKEALDVLHIGQERRQAAGYLVEAAGQCGNDDLILQGRREAFRSSSNAPNLLHLLAEAERQQVWKEEVLLAITTLQKGDLCDYYQKPLIAKLFLMAGDFKSLADLCKGEKDYGWSGGSPAALLFCAVLYSNSKRDKQCTLINRLLVGYTDDCVYFDSDPMNDEKPTTTFLQQINKGLAENDVSTADFSQFVEASMQTGQKRVEHIVSNTYRNAYERAANTLGAMAEMLASKGEKPQAKELLHKYYFKLYNRFPAFRREVRAVVAASPLLNGMVVK